MEDRLVSLKAVIDVFGDVHPLDYNAQTYLDKIKALPSAEPDVPDTNVGDIISRKAAIDALNDEFTIIGKTNAIVVQDYIRRVNNRLHNLPSAQPVARDINVLSNDLIIRQEAIDALKGLEFRHYMEFGEYIGEDTREVRLIRAEKAQDALQNLPSAEPERKTGRWVRITQGAIPEKYMCPFCHRTIENDGVESLLSMRFPFCHCGADMREGEQNG